MISVVLADDHRLVRKALKSLLEDEADIRVQGEAEDGLQVLGLVARLRPQVLIIDVKMAGLNGLDVIPDVLERVPTTRVLVLSMYTDIPYVAQALRNGAIGYLHKGDDPAELIAAVRRAADGRTYLSPDIDQPAVDRYLARPITYKHGSRDGLTHREVQVLTLVAQGKTSVEIADGLGISRRTVEKHRENAQKKLGLRNLVELLGYVQAQGWSDA